MATPPPEFVRVLGPYRSRATRWVIYLVGADDRRSPVYRKSEADATALAKKLRERVEGTPLLSVEAALAHYERHRRDKGNKPGSVKETSRRLADFFREPQLNLWAITEAKGEAYYRRYVDAGIAPDTHRGYLAEARSFLRWCVRQLAPEMLLAPHELDVLRLVDSVLPQFGIHFGAASEVELGDCHASTSTAGDGPVEILMRADHWDALAGSPSPARCFARSTAMHELAHAVLHVPVIRRRRNLNQKNLLNLVVRGSVEPFRDSEWQAHAMAGCLLMPRKMVLMVGSLDLEMLAEVFGVTRAFAKSQLKRLKVAM